jgi:hypothetical protein
MNLHIFNPEHDIALASNLSNFTAPHAGRQLRHDLGFLPEVWAEEGDCILVDDVELAQYEGKKFLQAMARQLGRSLNRPNYQFALSKPSACLQQTTSVMPWGWDRALRARLKRMGIASELMPSDQQLDDIRNLSHRRTSATLLPQLQTDGTIGEAFECTTPDEVEVLLNRYGRVVMKAPWSSSGRGLRFLSVDRTPFAMQAGWFRNVVANQGCVMVEPYYNKVKDFGMEFQAEADGRIKYLGLSLFHTANGAYTGNILATEKTKCEMISAYISEDLLTEVQEKICHELTSVYQGKYQGPFGVDMMIVAADEGYALHPCVEINLRRTMGHVALALSPHDDDVRRVMRIDYTNYRPTSASGTSNNYLLKINRL